MNKCGRNTMQTEPFPIYMTKSSPKSTLWKLGNNIWIPCKKKISINIQKNIYMAYLYKNSLGLRANNPQKSGWSSYGY